MISYAPQTNMVVWENEPLSERLIEVVPGSIRLQKNLVAAPCTVDAQSRAASLGVPAYSPILVDYDWPRHFSIKSPFAHQKEMASFLTLHHRAHNLAEIGTGKTLGVLWALHYLKTHGYLKRVLVAAPLSTLIDVWQEHIGKHFAGLLSCSVVAHDKKKRLAALAKDVDIYIINHDALGLPYVLKALENRKDIELVVIDESDRYRNRTNDRYKVMHAWVGDRALWHNTGTPTPQSPTDAWAQQNLLSKPPMSYRAFEGLTMLRVSQFKWVPKKEAQEQVVHLMRPAIRFRREDCIDIPPTLIVPRKCDYTPAQKKAITELKAKMRLTMSGKVIDAVNEAALRNKILQILAGAVYDEEHEVHKVDAEPRLDTLKDICSLSDRGSLVFTHVTSVAKMLAKELPGAELVTGATSLTERSAIYKRFQAGELKTIVAHPKCMSHGLTLTAADKIIWYSPVDGGDTYIQANGRITRPGQDRKTLIYQLWVDQLELEIFRRLQAKETLQGLVMKWIDTSF